MQTFFSAQKSHGGHAKMSITSSYLMIIMPPPHTAEALSDAFV